MLSVAFAAYIVADKDGVDRVLDAVGIFRIPLAIIIFAIVATVPFSVTDGLAVSNGVLFGPWLGAAINAAGIVIAAPLSYFVALRINKTFDVDRLIARLPSWARRFKAGSPAFLIVVRLIPGLGGTVASQIAAEYRVSLWRQMYTMYVVAIPLCALLAFGGDAVSSFVERTFIQPGEAFAAKHQHTHPTPPK